MVNLILARLLKASGSGEFYYAINNLSIITLLGSLSLESGMTYFLSKKQVDEKELMTISLLWSVIAGILVVIFFLLFPGNYFLAIIPYNKPLFIFLFITGNLLTTYFSGLFFGKHQFSFPHLVPAITNVVLFLFYGWILITKNQFAIPNVMGVYFASFLFNGILLNILYHSKYSKIFFIRVPTKDTLVKLFRYSGVALVANVVAFLAYRVDYWILKGFSPKIISDAALGNYIQVSKLVQLFLFAPTIIATVVFPASAAKTDSNFGKKVNKMIMQVLLLNAIACIALLVSGKWIFNFFYGDSFSLMYWCFVFSVPAILSISVIRILASYFAGINRIRYNLVGGLIALVVIVALNFWLIPLLGINGSALADSVGYLFYMVFLFACYHYNE
ncbi:MAG: polysaccharide biosynthesis C-terminal domain-containing protein [Chitinophagales bacterium]